MVEDIRLDATILTRIILKGVVNFESKFFQLDSFLNLFEFLSSLRKIDKIMINSPKFYFMMYIQVVLIFLFKICKFLFIEVARRHTSCASKHKSGGIATSVLLVTARLIKLTPLECLLLRVRWS
jgi:hypothetical protein